MTSSLPVSFFGQNFVLSISFVLENELKEIFDYIDVNADGFISLIDLQMVLNELMPKLSEKDVAEMFAIVKKTDKTQICYE